MGLTSLVVKVANPSRPAVVKRLTFLVDSGAVYSVVPATVLGKLEIKAVKRETFRLADGTSIVRRKGVALFTYGDRRGGADVIFGERGDSILLGALTLEALGLVLDPLRRELRPLPMMLAVLPGKAHPEPTS
jgi:predicted aspartyl protease